MNNMASASAAPCALVPFAKPATPASQSCPFFFKTRSCARTTQRFRASATQDEADCNTEECAPDKEVGKVSMEWLAGEKTKVVGTYPPRSGRGWTGYVEKDTAGQTNIYSVEPVVYVAETFISSGSAGSSSSGAENTAAVAAFIGLISVAAASSIILQLGKAPGKVETTEFSGQSLTYYINKFKTAEVIPDTTAPALVEASAQVQQEQETPSQDVTLGSGNEAEAEAETPTPTSAPGEISTVTLR
uniref:Uncharacterized protein n=1 Tax=Kalanchoe fedtschenkoi TaxID=63787 RepID=A0A7N0T5I9_KALFE